MTPLVTHNYLYDEGRSLPMLLLQGTVLPGLKGNADPLSVTDVFVAGVDVASDIRINS